MNKLDVFEKGNKYRNFEDEQQRLLFQRLAGTVTGMSWGIRNPKVYNNTALKFSVNGHHHKGHVYIYVTPADLFDVYYTTQKRNILKKSEDVYVDDLLMTIDEVVEKVPGCVQ